jgi:hypothetical protein
MRPCLAGTVLTVLLLAASAHAEQGAAPATPPAAPAAWAAPVAVPRPPTVTVIILPPMAPAPAPASVPPAFMDRFLAYDEAAGVVVQGRARQPLPREDFYLALHRPDLVEKSQAAAQRRLVLGVAAGLVIAAGVVTAIVPRLDMPNLNSGFCVQPSFSPSNPTGAAANYNNVCVPDMERREIISTIGIVGGASIGGLLIMLAAMSSPDVLSKDETTSLISQHNAALLRHLRTQERRFRLTPYASSQGGGVVAGVSF